jgi:hypothetical protein
VSQQETKTKGMCIATRCTTVDQFVQMFHRFVDEQSFFVSTLNTRPPGLETSFSVQLSDGTPVLRGMCIVQQAWSTPANPFKTPGVRLGIKRLTAQSTPVFQRLLDARNAKKPAGSQLATVVVAKPGTPRPIAKSPFTETAPAVSARSRVEINQPARPASEPTKVDLPRATTGDGVPRQITVETTDSTDEKTDVREPKRPIMPLPGSLVRPSIAVPKSIPSPAAARDSSPLLEVTPLAAVDVREVAKPIETAEPVADESRTPGSELVLPANPLMNLTDESLEGYVDCTLYEETGTFFPAEDDTSFDDDVIPPPAANGAAAATESDGVSRRATPGAIARGSAPVIANAVAGDPAPASASVANDTPPPPPPVDASAEPAPTLPLAAPTSEPTRIPPVTAAGEVLQPTRHKRAPWLLVGGGAGLLAIAAIVFAIASSSDGGARPPSTTAKGPVEDEATARSPAVQLEKDVAPDTQQAVARSEPADEPPTGDSPPLVGSGPCKVIVRTTPAASFVRIDGNTVGPSPLTVATECGKRKVEVVHPRYALGTRMVTLSEGTTESLDVTLSRPSHVVTVTSQPSGAQVFLDGRLAGTTPTKLNVLGFVVLKLEIKKIGYQPEDVRLYSKKAQDKVGVRLTKW